MDENYTEDGVVNGARLDLSSVEDEEVRNFFATVKDMSFADTLLWLSRNASRLGQNIFVTDVATCTTEEMKRAAAGDRPKLIVISRPLHTIQYLDEFLTTANSILADGGYLYCNAMTAVLKRQMLLRRWPWGVSHLLVMLHYVWHRVMPKLKATKGLYYAVTGGKNRTFNRVEIMGRVYKAGFDVEDEQFRSGHYFVTGRKARKPIVGNEPSESPVVALRRVGKGGQDIVVYKFRTMYSYSEYIQPYVYERQNLKVGGKMKDDYRINFIGRLLRPIWLDELPMIYNLIRGDIKLIGVRPLSHHYFGLYTPEMQELRVRVRPGLLPPFYYERQLPRTLDEIQASERRYIEAYLEHPFRTDWRYFWGILFNIIFRRHRSS